MRLLWNSLIAAATCAATLVRAAAGAADAKADDITRAWFGKALGDTKAYACFERTYDAAHLAKHPLQTVASMMLLVRGERIPEDPSANYSFALRISYKDAPARFFSSGYCGHSAAGATGLRCGVDCDGGRLDLALMVDRQSTLVSLERIAIWPQDAAADAPRAYLDAGADDKAFRLQRVALSRCVPQLGNEEDIAGYERTK